MVNTCPIFTDKPQPQTSFWHLSLNSRWIEKNKSDQEKWSSRLYSDKRSCTLPIYIPEYRFLQPGTKLTVQKIQESWDYENGYRLWLHGTVKTQKEETVDFEFEGFRKTEDIHFRQYIQQKFDSCE